MANTVVYLDGFENIAATLALATTSAGGTYITTGPGQGSVTSLKMGAGTSWSYTKTLAPAPILDLTWWITSLMLYVPATAALGKPLLGFSNSLTDLTTSSSGTQMALFINPNRSISVRHSATSATSALNVIPFDQWVHIEYHHRYGTTAGDFEVRINGSAVLTGTGDNSTVANPVNMCLCGANGALSSTNYILVDDLIVAQSADSVPAWFGISKVRHYTPSSTSTGQWIGSDGNSTDNHFLVDDVVPDSTDFVTSTAGSHQRDLYGHDTAPSGSTVHAVQVRAAAALDEIGMDDFSMVIKSGSTEVATRRPIGVGTPAWLESTVQTVDPATLTPWTRDTFNASLFGIKS